MNGTGNQDLNCAETVPAGGWLYHARRELIIQRKASNSPEQRERINLLLGQLDCYERAEPKHRVVLAKMIERQMSLL